MGSIEVREVIDGQERLTALQVLIAALRDLRRRGIETRSLSQLTKTLVNDADYVDGPNEEFKLWPNDRDRDAYAAVMRGLHLTSSCDPVLPRIASAHVYFREQIDALVSGCKGESNPRSVRVRTTVRSPPLKSRPATKVPVA